MADNGEEVIQETESTEQIDDSILLADDTEEEIAIAAPEEEGEGVNGAEAEEADVSGEVDTTEDVNDTAKEEVDETGDHEESAVDLGHEDDIEGEVAEIKDDDIDKDDDDEEDDEEEELEEDKDKTVVDPNVMPQVNVALLNKRRWNVKVYPLKPADFTSGLIARVFKAARESLLYLMTGKQSLGKGEMYIPSVTESVRVVRNLMTLDSHFPEINVEIVRKNAEGEAQEKAYMRFDTKMVRMLFVGPGGSFTPQGRLFGRKRERVIGSVFLKNLPPGTTKNMLRVMFPFAQEINYNPEKYTEGTARLVLKTRSTVIPCLKAFAKVQLGGNILELHPLEKKKPPPPRPRHKASETKDKEGSKSENHSETKSSDDIKKEGGKEDTKATDGSDKEKKDSPKKKESTPAKKEGDAKSSSKDKNSQQKRPPPKNRPGDKSNLNRERFQRGKTFGDNRGPGLKYAMRKAGLADRRQSGGQRGGRSQGFANRSFGSGPRTPRGNDRRMSGGGGGGGGGGMGGGREMAAKAEATQDMMILQNQLNMAIKSQLAMLNQTKMAVEVAKREASTVRLGMAGTSGLSGGGYGLSQMSEQRRDSGFSARSRSRDRAFNDSGNWGYKRSASQADLNDDYDDDYGRKRGPGNKGNMRSPQGRGAGANRSAQRSAAQGRPAQTNQTPQNRRRGQMQQRGGKQNNKKRGQNRSGGGRMGGGYDDDTYGQSSSYSMRDQLEDAYSSYGASNRSYASGLGAANTGRSAYYDNDNYGYRY